MITMGVNLVEDSQVNLDLAIPNHFSRSFQKTVFVLRQIIHVA